jgi:tRNA-dihydrouridine synthase B
VCNVAAGSALLRDESLVRRILEHVVAAVTVPVTLKIRTGWDPSCRNGVQVAMLAEQVGIQAIAVHGRTRNCGFHGPVEFQTATAIKRAVSVPVIVNGDIDSPQRARAVLEQTGADGVMIGRAAQGRPWIFREISSGLAAGTIPAPPAPAEIGRLLVRHLRRLYDFYGPVLGVRMARKHINWYLRGCPGGVAVWRRVNRTECSDEQLAIVSGYFDQLLPGCAA